MNKPKIFIGSSTEGLRIAHAIQANLDYECHCTIWSQGVFGLSGGTLETLVNAAPEFDFAILVVTPDDLIIKRDATRGQARDNVIFELGLLIGILGRQRTFFVHERQESLKKRGLVLELPSDLAGITPATFEERGEPDLRGALGSACYEIKMAIARAKQLAADASRNRRVREALVRSVPVSAHFKEEVWRIVEEIGKSHNLHLRVTLFDNSDPRDPEASTIFMFAVKTDDEAERLGGMLVLTPANYQRLGAMADDELKIELERLMFGIAALTDVDPKSYEKAVRRICDVVVSWYGVSQIGKGGYKVSFQNRGRNGPLIIGVRDISLSIEPLELDKLLALPPIRWTMIIAEMVASQEPALYNYLTL